MATSRPVEIDEARRMVLASVRTLPAEPVALDAALGRVLAEDVVAPAAVPDFDNSAMDGYAVRAGDLAAASAASPVRLRVIGESRAGLPAGVALAGGEAIAISTGAMLPAGADAVVRVEDTRAADGAVEVLVATAGGTDIRRAGEDIRAGDTALARGAILGPAELGVLASVGRDPVRCARRPRVGLVVTGDELVGPGEPLRRGAVRDSSSHTIAALTRRAGAELANRAVVADEPAATRAAIAAALEAVDVTVICGGVSVGEHDHVRPSLRALGAEQSFWGLALKPGRPAWFGTHGQALVFALPGNPVSAMVTFTLLVAPALRALQGAPLPRARPTAVLDRDYDKRPGRAHAVRCRLRAREDGWHAEPTGAQGSHVLTSMLGADALAIIPSESRGARAGQRVEIEPLALSVGDPA